MKRVYVIRHAKSSWADLTQKDIDRPLNKRGMRDLPIMAEHCLDKGYTPEMIITSDAKRAHTTALGFKNKMGVEDSRFIVDPNLYLAPESTYIQVCRSLHDDVDSVMLFGHNPGITYLANTIPNTMIDNVPTCGVLVVDVEIDSWKDLSLEKGKLIEFLYPKGI